jgi:hypothetical protein
MRGLAHPPAVDGTPRVGSDYGKEEIMTRARTWRWVLAVTTIAAAALVTLRTGGGPVVGTAVNAYPLGWAWHPAGAASATRTCVAMATHRPPADYALSEIRVACWNGTAWEPLGGAPTDAVQGQPAGVGGPAFAPAMVLVGDVPYVAWYQGGAYNKAHVFVAHHDGAVWVLDGPTGVGEVGPAAFAPAIADCGGTIYVAWLNYGCARVSHLTGDAWVSDDGGHCLQGDPPADGARALALASVGGVPHVAITAETSTLSQTAALNMIRTRTALGARVLRLTAGAWEQVGDVLSPGAQVHGLDLAEHGGQPWVAWVTQTGRASIARVAHLEGGAWAQHGDGLNRDPVAGWAQRPSLSSDGAAVWVAFSEHSPAQPAQIEVRHGTTGVFATDPRANVDPAASAQEPRLFLHGSALRLVFTEKPALPGVGTVYVRGLP